MINLKKLFLINSASFNKKNVIKHIEKVARKILPNKLKVFANKLVKEEKFKSVKTSSLFMFPFIL